MLGLRRPTAAIIRSPCKYFAILDFLPSISGRSLASLGNGRKDATVQTRLIGDSFCGLPVLNP